MLFCKICQNVFPASRVKRILLNVHVYMGERITEYAAFCPCCGAASKNIIDATNKTERRKNK